MSNENNRMLTPPELAKRWGVAADKVLHLIHTGQLVGVNLACNPKGKPRWRISQSEIERFEQSRSSKPPLPKQRRQRRRAAVDVGKEYF